MSLADFAYPYIRILNDPHESFARLNYVVNRTGNAEFVLCTGGSRTSDTDGISAAGASPNDRRYTPAVDAEALVSGKSISAKLAVSPEGIVSPVVISRAVLNSLKLGRTIVDAGCFFPPAVACLSFGREPSDCVSSGMAMARDRVQLLFDQGMKLGAEMANKRDYLVVAECVPGGTTTALAVLKALGHAADGMTSSSLPNSNHAQKLALIERGLAKCGIGAEEFERDPLLALASVGDPVQAAIAGFVFAASKRVPVFMGGGSQMLAIWALLQAYAKSRSESVSAENIFVCSTKWVGFDRSAAVWKLARLLNAPFAVACPDFTQSRHNGFRAYEEGHVKEGAGAGASLCLAFMHELSHDYVIKSIDAEYDNLVPSIFVQPSVPQGVSVAYSP